MPKASGWPSGPAAVSGVKTYAIAATIVTTPASRTAGERGRQIERIAPADAPPRIRNQSGPSRFSIGLRKYWRQRPVLGVGEDVVRDGEVRRGPRGRGSGRAGRSARGGGSMGAGCRRGSGCGGTRSRRPPRPLRGTPRRPSSGPRAGRGTGRRSRRPAATPAIVSFDPSAMPIARPATRIAPSGRGRRRGPGGDLSAEMRPSSFTRGRHSEFPRDPLRRPPLSGRPDVDQDRRCRQQHRHRDRVRGGGAGLSGDHWARVHGDRHGCQGQGGDAVGAADAPRRQQCDAQPAEVDERREEVPVEEDDPGAVQELGVLRIEPVQVEGVGEVHPPDRAGVRDPGRERAVVPERVEGEHPPRPDVLEAGRPVGGDEGRCRQRQKQLGKGDRRAGGADVPARAALLGVWPRKAPRTPKWTPRPTTRAAGISTPGTRIPKAPRSWSRIVSSATARTASASRAGAPSQAGSSRRRSGTRPSPSGPRPARAR